MWPSRFELAAPILGADGQVTGVAGRDRFAPDAFALLAWLHRDTIIQRICAEIDAVADDRSALDPAQRAKKLAQADAAILLAEREEEAAICEALSRGFLIDRREDADPRAIVGIEGPAPRN
ncbi:hypothetical protein [Methylocystis echinoides]|uniref:Uncharacterized protein n=1 Tax=Methylocystis echinoides TaxID=29468 RepID=A0A9W6LSM9_9HYPH|nr:hypothetical protein [Methylocystis echinoides]GLI93667.1 hypothetical protein LMG27198_26590 [Methylocystis echinoides]